MKKMSKEERIFINLLECCYQDDSYSLREICPKLGFSCQEIIELAAKHEQFAYILELCRSYCAYNVEIAGLMKRIPANTAVRYLYENNYRLSCR